MSERGEIIRVFLTKGSWHWELKRNALPFLSCHRDSCCDEALRNGQACEGYITQDAAMKAGGLRIGEYPQESDAGVGALA
jgi:hypothetical protein